MIVTKGNSNSISVSLWIFCIDFQYSVKLELPFLLSPLDSLIVHKGNSNSISVSFWIFYFNFQYLLKLHYLLSPFVNLIVNKGNSNFKSVQYFFLAWAHILMLVKDHLRLLFRAWVPADHRSGIGQMIKDVSRNSFFIFQERKDS